MPSVPRLRKDTLEAGLVPGHHHHRTVSSMVFLTFWPYKHMKESSHFYSWAQFCFRNSDWIKSKKQSCLNMRLWTSF
jgi:hypothetical protein